MVDKNLMMALRRQYFPVFNGEGIAESLASASALAESGRPDGPGRVVLPSGDAWERHYITWRGTRCRHLFGTGVEPVTSGWEWRLAEE